MVRAKLMNGRYKHTSESPASSPQTDLTSQHRRQSHKAPLLARQGPRRARVGAHDEDTVLALARNRRLSAYDASYLETALRRGDSLATLDRALARAASAEGVAVIA